MSEPLPVLLMARELGSGGCERDLARLAKALDRTRYSPHVACFRAGGFRFEELKEAGIPVLSFSIQSLVRFSGISGEAAMGRYLRRHRIGLIHCFDAPTAAFATLAALFLRIPLVAANLWFRGTIPKRLQYALRIVDRMADAIVVNSNAVARELTRQEGVSPDLIHLCHNGVDTTIFKPGTVPRPPEVRDASLVVGSVCALRPEKRLDRLLEAFACVRPSFPGTRLLIVGSGATLPALQALRKKLALEDACVFAPANKDVADWMRAMDIFVLSSDTESFPNALLEAMACGCAVIGSRVGGVPELIEDGRSGLLFDTGDPSSLVDALTKLIQDARLRRKLGASAAVRACSCFSLTRSVHCVQQVYEKVLRSRGRIS